MKAEHGAFGAGGCRCCFAHVTQRGNARRIMLDCDRNVYPDLLRDNLESCKVSLLGYYPMSNHSLIAFHLFCLGFTRLAA